MKLKKTSIKTLKLFFIQTVIGYNGRGYRWDELIKQGLVTEKSVNDLSNPLHSITPKGLRLLANMLEVEELEKKYGKKVPVQIGDCTPVLP